MRISALGYCCFLWQLLTSLKVVLVTTCRKTPTLNQPLNGVLFKINTFKLELWVMNLPKSKREYWVPLNPEPANLKVDTPPLIPSAEIILQTVKSLFCIRPRGLVYCIVMFNDHWILKVWCRVCQSTNHLHVHPCWRVIKAVWETMWPTLLSWYETCLCSTRNTRLREL